MNVVDINKRKVGRPPKSAELKGLPMSFRPTDKEKAMITWAARVKGMTPHEFMPYALTKFSGAIAIGEPPYERNWADFWDPHPGVYQFNLLTERFWPKRPEEEEIFAFAKEFWEFFFTTAKCEKVKTENVKALWDKFNQYRATRAKNFEQCGKEMAADLKKAGITPPQWPRK
jgi:hypothetical protein